ncbi:MAG: ABC transporter ATP-binding protein [Oscillospiraceae bacterium]|nr:ABC transporter ATP-binding protein [Oscillospiraceae bacterium]
MFKIAKFFKKYSFLIILILLFTVVQAFSDLTLPTLMSNIIDVGIINTDVAYIVQTGVFMLMFSLLSGIMSITVGFVSAKVSAGVCKNLRSSIFDKIQGFSLTDIDQFGATSLITRTTNDITQIQNFLIMFLRIVIMSPIMTVGGLIMAYNVNKSLSSIVLIAIPILASVVVTIAFAAMPIYKVIQSKLDGLNLIARENLTGLRVIKAFRTTDYEKNRFDKSNKNLSDITVKVQKIMGLMGPGIMLTLNVTIIVIMWFGAKKVSLNEMAVGEVIAFTQYVMQIMISMMMMSFILVMYPKASVSAERVAEVLNKEFSIKDEILDKKINDKNLNNEIYVEFKDVCFKYQKAEEMALSNISFRVEKGKTLSIIGSTGSGKSTIVNLIPRMYDIESGEIIINGKNIKEYSQLELRSKIGLVPQKATLFTGTIEENLRFGKKDATQEEIIQACEISSSLNFIEKKPDKFNENVAQGGKNFSGGQKQRIAIARAIIKDADVYIFDDSFSALDYKTDKEVRKKLKNITQNSVVIVVAQRIMSIKDSDNILVLDKGKIVGYGSHKDLINNCEIYKEIAESQLSKEELKSGE